MYDRSLFFLPEAKRTLFALPPCCTRTFDAVSGVSGTSDSSSSPTSESVEKEERGMDGERGLEGERPMLYVEDVDMEDCEGRRRDDGGL